MRKMLARSLAAIMLLSAVLCQSLVFAETGTRTVTVNYSNITITVDGVPVVYMTDSEGNLAEPFIYNGRTYLPVAAVGVALNKGVTWDGETQTVYLEGTYQGEMPTGEGNPMGVQEVQIDITYNNISIIVDGTPVEFMADSEGNVAEPFIYNGRTYLPVAAVAQALNMNVSWDGETKTVALATPAAEGDPVEEDPGAVEPGEDDGDDVSEDPDMIEILEKLRVYSEAWFVEDLEMMLSVVDEESSWYKTAARVAVEMWGAADFALRWSDFHIKERTEDMVIMDAYMYHLDRESQAGVRWAQIDITFTKKSDGQWWFVRMSTDLSKSGDWTRPEGFEFDI